MKDRVKLILRAQAAVDALPEGNADRMYIRVLLRSTQETRLLEYDLLLGAVLEAEESLRSLKLS